MSDPVYRYLLCDLLTDRIVTELPLSGVSFDRRLCRTGSLSGTLTAGNARAVETARLLYGYAGRSALWVYRDDALWWGGIPWTVTAGQDSRGAVQMQVQGATFDSYAHRRRLYQDVIYADIDQGWIIADLWRRIQADPSGNIGVKTLTADASSGYIGAEATLWTTGVRRDRTWLASDLNYVGKLIEDLGDVIDGPEHTIDVYADTDGIRHKDLRVASQLGSSEPRTVFQRAITGGGRVVDWTHVADAVDGGTAFETRGGPDPYYANAGEDQPPLMSRRVDRDDLLAAGWPRLDVTADYSDVTDIYTLWGYRDALAASNGGSLPTSDYNVQVGNSGWTPSRLGDAVRIKMADLWHDGTDVTVRPVGCEVTAPSNDAAESVHLLLSEDE